MTTDPTAKHHAQILDWLSAALTDPDTTTIYLHQDADEAGTWEIHTDRKVDPAKEATATSQADRDTLYNLAGTYQPPAWVEEALEDPDVVDLENSCQCDDCQRVGRLINSAAADPDGVLPGFSGTEFWSSHGGYDLRVAFYGFDALVRDDEDGDDR